MSLFLDLLLGHLLGDFLLQPGRLVLAKRDGAPGLVLHTLIVGAVSSVVMFSTISVDWPAVVLVTALHLVIERLTILTYTRTSTRGLFTLLFDQTLHMLSIALVVWTAGAWTLDAGAVVFGVRVPVGVLASLDGIAAVMLFGSILAFETGNAFLGEVKGQVLRLDLARVGGYLERGSAFAAALAIHPAAIVVPFVPRLVFAATRPKHGRARPALEAVTGLALCVLVYAAVAAIAHVTPSASTAAEPLAAALGLYH